MEYEILSQRKVPVVKISDPSDAFVFLKRYGNKRQEHFLLATINAGNEMIKIHIVSIGLLNRTLIHPREVFHRAIVDNAHSIILAHNHPSGDLKPSREDREATQRLVNAGKLMGIEVLDHLIIGRKGFYSFRESGDMPLPSGGSCE